MQRWVCCSWEAFFSLCWLLWDGGSFSVHVRDHERLPKIKQLTVSQYQCVFFVDIVTWVSRVWLWQPLSSWAHCLHLNSLMDWFLWWKCNLSGVFFTKSTWLLNFFCSVVAASMPILLDVECYAFKGNSMLKFLDHTASWGWVFISRCWLKVCCSQFICREGKIKICCSCFFQYSCL